ncbi:MAG: hypothetical protein ABIQ93_14605, partial [Saprospiraceae bacterium]
MLSCSLFSLRRSPLTRKLCLVTAFSLLLQVVLPVTTFALTSGPAAPEFSSFEPVATTDMVNDFTGDFTYNVPVINIPGPDGGGYALSLSYHAGVSPEEEASWVGFGWTLNPGAVNRQKRGFPDDFNGKPIQRYNKTKPNWTQSAAFSVNMEYNSVDKEKKSPGEGQEKATGFLNTKINKNNAGFKMKMPWQKDDDDADFPISVSLSKSVRYNNYSGFSIANGFGSNVKGLVQLNMNQSGGETTYGITIPATLIAKIWKNRIDKLNSEAAKSFTDGKITDGLQKNVQSTKLKKSYSTTNKLGLFGASYGAWSFNAPAVPYSIAYTVGRAWNFSTSVELNPYGPIGFQVGLAGNFNTQVNVPRTDITAFGYMYNPNFSSTYSDRVSNTYGDAVNHLIPEADFQLEKASTFNKHDRNLGIPFANADIFSGSGNEAIGGFRFFHRDIGNFYPTPVTNKQQIHQKGVELGIGGTIQIGLDVGLGLQKTQVERWKNLDPTTTLTNYNPQFGSTTPLLQFMNDAGGELRYSDNDKLQYAKIGLGRALDGNTLSGQTQMITSRQGQTAPITYDKDSDGKISAISVINQDGTRSKYGENIQVKSETELTIGVEGLDFPKNRYLVHPGTPVYETDPLKNQIAVGMKSDQNYASTWLLTETTSFDYVDVNPNGADNNDFGGWTKFSYRKAHEDYRFRAPYTGLLYNRGNLYDLHDQTGGYSAGVKQVKYLSQIETKSHIAFFVTNKTKGNLLDLSSLNLSQADKTALEAQLNGSDQNRFDGLDASAVNTAPNTGDDPAATDNTAKGSHRLEYLERIVLYAKSNLKTPITTTFFEYDYSLCKGLPNSDATTAAQSGKLTLKRVWTEAYGAFQSRIAPYRFE